MADSLAGIIATLSTVSSLGFLGYASASVAVVSGAIALPALTTVAAIILLHAGFSRIREA